MIKVITFDLDDTLWDVNPVLESAERAVYQWLSSTCPAAAATHSLLSLRTLRTQLSDSRPDLTHQITESRRLTLQTVLQQHGLSRREATERADEGIAIFLEARHNVQCYPVVEAMLEELAAEFTLAALTNGNADIFRTPLGRHFTFAYSAEELNSSKPQPAHFERTEKRTGAAPGEILHVGDHLEHDIKPASARGWHTLWVNQRRGSAADKRLDHTPPPGSAPSPDHAGLLSDTRPRQHTAGEAQAPQTGPVQTSTAITASPSATATVEDINELPEAIRRLVRAHAE